MRRFMAGVLVGVIVGWAVAWWRFGQAGQVLPEKEWPTSVQIPLPELPWGSGAEDDLPGAEPATSESAPPAQEDVEDVLVHAQQAVDGDEPLLAYCARCRAKRPIQDPEPTATSDGRPAVRGACPECGAKMFRFVSY
ncbi:MAG: DUF5679 domain-containing protein [Anaerolineae bacterium]